MDTKKNKIVGAAFLAFGIVALLFQWYRLQQTGSFLAFGALSAALIVLGIAMLAFNVDMSDSQVTNPDGSKSNMSFKDMPGSMKITIVLALAAAVAQFAAFKFGLFL